MLELNPDQAAIIENRFTHRVGVLRGPCRSHMLGEKIVHVFPLTGEQPYFTYPNVNLKDGVTCTIVAQPFYEPDLERMILEGKWHKYLGFIKSKWTVPIREYLNYVVRRSVLELSWQQLLELPTQERLEKRWAMKLEDTLGRLGVKFVEVRLIDIDLPKELQEMIKKDQRLRLLQELVDEETFKRIAVQEFSQAGAMGWPMFGGGA